MCGRKMAKSAGNFQRVTELTERGIDPLAFRYLALTSRYAHKLDYSDASIDGAAAALGVAARAAPVARTAAAARVRGRRPAPLHAGAAGDRPVGIARGLAGHGGEDRGIRPATDRDGRTRRRPVVRGRPRRTTSGSSTPSTTTSISRRRSSSCARSLRADLPADERRWLALDADRVLGLDLDRVWDEADAAQDEPCPRRERARSTSATAARAARDFARADALRAEIEAAAGRWWTAADGRPSGGARGGLEPRYPG